MKGTIVAAALAALLCCSLAQAAPPTVAEVLEKHDFKLFVRLLKFLKVHDDLKVPRRMTLFAPTDAAMTKFLKDAGLTIEDIQKRPALADRLLGYHVIPRLRGTGAKIPKGGSYKAQTALPGDFITAEKDQKGTLTLVDVQGNRANIVKPNLDAGESVVHGIDRVLLNGDVFVNLASALRFNKQWDTLASAVKRAGWESYLKDPKTEVTLFAPRNAAFKAIPGFATLPVSTLRSVLEYHAVKGYRQLPAGFKSREPVETLYPGHKLSVDITKSGGKIQKVMVVPEKGSAAPPAKVALPNIWAGKSIINGIEGILLPRGFGGKAVEERAATAGRKLLGRNDRYRSSSWDDGDDLAYRQSAASSATQSAIRSAASGSSSASDATSVGSAAASSVGECSYCW